MKSQALKNLPSDPKKFHGPSQKSPPRLKTPPKKYSGSPQRPPNPIPASPHTSMNSFTPPKKWPGPLQLPPDPIPASPPTLSTPSPTRHPLPHHRRAPGPPQTPSPRPPAPPLTVIAVRVAEGPQRRVQVLEVAVAALALPHGRGVEPHRGIQLRQPRLVGAALPVVLVPDHRVPQAVHVPAAPWGERGQRGTPPE